MYLIHKMQQSIFKITHMFTVNENIPKFELYTQIFKTRTSWMSILRITWMSKFVSILHVLSVQLTSADDVCIILL